ncbi:hypothetical protein MYP14_25555 (plasmid) [Rhodococcus pyridinivorans]|uniref:hypothetical protein n=1 Tax=Rhodococcus pyridinivorans TaxID=103816 RepID=UPI001FFFA47C|nr:hypothetical protein [Rhodococcus pyridinivorans]UPK66443.1 hypothetical protein MYP14_25555 [Rhodococcus pyridinivorans]
MALHTTVNIGAVDRLISEAAGVANATSAVKHGMFFGICLGASIIIVALRVPDVDRQRRWIAPLSAGATAATAVAVALFFSAERAPQAIDGYQFDELYVHLPGYAESAAFVMGVAAVLCTVITVVVLLGWDLGTPSGRGLAVLACGVAVLASYAWIRGGYIVAARLGCVETSTFALDLTTQLALIGAVLTTLGLLWSSIEGMFRSQKQHRDFAELYMVVVKQRWPGVVRDSWPSFDPSRRTADRASEVLDALSMQADADKLPEHGVPATAESVARWVDTGEPGGIGVDGLRPPVGFDAVKWVRAVGRAFEDLRVRGVAEMQK